MIRYQLKCDKDHQFEGWFGDSEDFDRQCARGLVTCPTCGSARIEKALMAPNVSSPKRRKHASPQAEPVAPDATAMASVPAGADKEVVAAIRKFRQYVRSNSEYVGDRFAEEAKRMHYEETEERSIYGEASLNEAKELHEEGIPVVPLPRLPEDEN